jgi:hypothetical protein
MSYHSHQTLGVREIDPDTYAAWVAAGNPKAQAYTPIADPPDQYAQFDGAEWVWPVGMSPEERQAAALKSQWAQQSADRKTRAARAVLAEPPTPENLPNQLAALRHLSGV